MPHSHSNTHTEITFEKIRKACRQKKIRKSEGMKFKKLKRKKNKRRLCMFLYALADNRENKIKKIVCVCLYAFNPFSHFYCKVSQKRGRKTNKKMNRKRIYLWFFSHFPEDVFLVNDTILLQFHIVFIRFLLAYHWFMLVGIVKRMNNSLYIILFYFIWEII